jgi:predicted DNA-binding transcriptional regulator AlpA
VSEVKVPVMALPTKGVYVSDITLEPPPAQILYSVADIARLTPWSRSTVYEFVNAGELPARKGSTGSMVVTHEDLMRFIDGLTPVTPKGAG